MSAFFHNYSAPSMASEAPDSRLLERREARTRKPRRCEVCGCTINPGGLYTRTTSIEDGEFSVFIECGRGCVGVY